MNRFDRSTLKNNCNLYYYGVNIFLFIFVISKLKLYNPNVLYLVLLNPNNQDAVLVGCWFNVSSRLITAAPVLISLCNGIGSSSIHILIC